MKVKFFSTTIVCLFILMCFLITSCDKQECEFIGESKLINATSHYADSRLSGHWLLEFENGIVLITTEGQFKPWIEGRVYEVYFNPSTGRSLLKMKKIEEIK